ncbi:MAG TPA: PEP-CTERM sorting domain-containing protein [Gemmatimonadaceae bacterium]
MTRLQLVAAAAAMFVVGSAVPGAARAQSYNFSFAGPGVGGTLMLSYGAATDATYPNAFKITGISGSIFDSNNGLGLTNVSVGSLVPVNHAAPEPANHLAPNDFSKVAVATGLPAQSGGFVSYDNLFWPAGSPQTASDYPPHGGFLDIYGLLFNIGNGQFVNIWSNGSSENGGPASYGFSVSNADRSLDYVGGGVSTTTTPEPGTLWLVGSGLVGLVGMRRRTLGV